MNERINAKAPSRKDAKTHMLFELLCPSARFGPIEGEISWSWSDPAEMT